MSESVDQAHIDPAACFAFGQRLCECSEQDAVESVLIDAARQLGFVHVSFAACFPALDKILTLGNYPSAWRMHYEQAEYLHHDPVVRHCLIHSSAMLWHDLHLTPGKRGELERRIMREAAAFGLIDGVSLPVHGAGAEVGALSLVNASVVPPLSQSQLDGLHFLAGSVHAALRKALSDQLLDGSLATQLTGRERECLLWTANGKTAWEISRILELAESTVTFHLKNAIAKMDVNNRSQAVAKAIAQSQISLIQRRLQ